MIVSRSGGKFASVLGAVASVAIGGCASSYRSLPRLGNRAEIVPTRGFEVSGPDLRQTPEGTYAWGRVCRTAFGIYTPRGLRMELADAGDQVAADSFGFINPQVSRSQRCGFYTFRTDWRVSANQHVHLCVVPYFGEPAKPCLEGKQQ